MALLQWVATTVPYITNYNAALCECAKGAVWQRRPQRPPLGHASYQTQRHLLQLGIGAHGDALQGFAQR